MLQICESMETQAQILNVPHAVEKTAEQMSFRRNTVASSMSFKQDCPRDQWTVLAIFQKTRPIT